MDKNMKQKGNRVIGSCFLEDLLSDSLTSSPAVSVRTIDQVRDVASLLPHNLETFTDSLVVTQDDKPVGIIGSREILEGVLKNPSATFFDNTITGNLMSDDKLIILKPKTTLFTLLQLWKQTRRAFAIIPNQYHGYSAISARKLMEIGASCKTDVTVASIPKKEIITFRKDNSVMDIISTMLENKTRKLILKGTSFFISDRIIMDKIARELDCLRNTESFLEMKADIFKLEEVKKISNNLKINEASKIMYNMQSPYLMIENQVITPWDIAMSLSLDTIYN